MNKSIYIAFILFMSTFRLLNAQNPQLQWAIQTSSPNFKQFLAFSVDGQGNSFAVMRSSFDFTVGGTEITGGGGGTIFLKIDPEGNVVWVKKLQSQGQQLSTSYDVIATDENNNVYLSVYVNSNGITVNASIQIDDFTASSQFSRDHFLIKFDAEGNPLWSTTVASPGATGVGAVAPEIVISADGSIYRSGRIDDTLSFNGTTLINLSISSIYIEKLDLDGNSLWAKAALPKGLFGTGTVYKMKTDNEGNLYVAGEWAGDSLKIDDLYVVNDLAFLGIKDRWVCKITPEGTTAWLAREHSSLSDIWSNIEISPEGELLVLSDVLGAPLNVGDFVVTQSGTAMSRYSPDGEVISAISLAPDGGYMYGFERDGAGSFFITGSINSSSFNLGDFTLMNAGGTTGTDDTFVAKIDATGEVHWVYTMGSPDTEAAVYLGVVDPSHFIIAGEFNGADFNIQGTNLSSQTAFATEHFIASFSTPLATRTAEALQQILAYPNPFTERVHFDPESLQLFQNATLTLYSSAGTEVYRVNLEGPEAGSIHLAHLPQGAYVARISDGIRSLYTKIIKQ